jgi:hypothetical protein
VKWNVHVCKLTKSRCMQRSLLFPSLDAQRLRLGTSKVHHQSSTTTSNSTTKLSTHPYPQKCWGTWVEIESRSWKLPKKKKKKIRGQIHFLMSPTHSKTLLFPSLCRKPGHTSSKFDPRFLTPNYLCFITGPTSPFSSFFPLVKFRQKERLNNWIF